MLWTNRRIPGPLPLKFPVKKSEIFCLKEPPSNFMGTHGVIYTFDFMSEKTLLGFKIKKDATVKLHF